MSMENDLSVELEYVRVFKRAVNGNRIELKHLRANLDQDRQGLDPEALAKREHAIKVVQVNHDANVARYKEAAAKCDPEEIEAHGLGIK